MCVCVCVYVYVYVYICIYLKKSGSKSLNNLPIGDKLGFPGGSVVKNLPANAEDAGWISESERSPRERNGNPL